MAIFGIVAMVGYWQYGHLQARTGPPERFGVNTHALNTRGVAEINTIGAHIVRTDVFAWDVIEPQKGRFDFSWTDAAVSWARRNDIELLGILLYTPPWESGLAFTPTQKPHTDCGIPPSNTLHGSADQFRVYPPKNPQDFARFVSATVKRYPDIRFWQVWNEPNNPIFWQPTPDAVAYTAMLKSAWTAIKKANPKAQVVLGGISLMDLKYLGQLYALGAGAYFDIMAVHPYNPAQSPSAYVDHELRSLHAFMARHGDDDKKIWITEIGWPTGTSAVSVSEKTQAAYVQQLYDITGALDFVGPVFWHTLEDCSIGYQREQLEHNFGLFRSDHSAKPAARTYRQITP